MLLGSTPFLAFIKIIIAFESILLVVCVALQVFMRDVNMKKKKRKNITKRYKCNISLYIRKQRQNTPYLSL